MNICVYGAASDTIDESYKNAARELGKKLAEQSFGMVFGGGATGMMGAAARGLQSVAPAPDLIGVAPTFFDRPGVLYPGCTQMIWTETMRERKQKMEDLSDGFVVLPGGTGTLEEFFEILTLKQLGRHNKPIVLFNVNGYYDRIRDLLQHGYEENFIQEFQLSLCRFAETSGEVMEVLMKELGFRP